MLSSGHKRILLLAFLLATAAPELVTMGFGPLTPFLVQAFALTEAQVGLIGSSMAVGSLLFSLPAGALVDSWGSRPLLTASVFVALFLLLSLSLATGFFFLLTVFFLSGSFRPLCGIASTRAALLSVSQGEQTTAVGVVHVGPSLASAVASAIIPALALAVGWRLGLRFLAAGLLPLGVWLTWILRRQSELRAPATDRQRDPFSVLGIPDFRKCLAVWACLTSGIFAFLTFFVLYLHAALGLRETLAGGFLAIAQAMAVVGRPMWGMVSWRFFAGNRVKPAKILGGLGAVTFAGLALLPPEPPAVLMAIIAIAAGIGTLSVRPVGTTLAVQFVPGEDAGRALALLSMVTWTSAMLMPAAVGFIVTNTGSWRLAWLIVAGIMSLSVPMLVRFFPADVGEVHADS